MTNFKSIQDEIIELTALEVANKIRSREWSARQVMESILESAKQAQISTNSIVLLKDQEALEASERLDKDIEAGINFPESEYPFLGVPLSVKDYLHVAGWPTWAGYRKVGKVNQLEDAALVTILKKLGCIPYCKTNVPQLGASTECDNPVFGTTKNPYNAEFTSGGSCGGEAALIGSQGSILGIGSDYGGSLRVPASFCGVYSFKPTSGRFPTAGHFPIMSGQDSIATVTGPLGKSVDDIAAMFKYVAQSEPWKLDSECSKINYEPFELPKDRKYKIGYVVSNKLFPSTPACERAVLETVKLLRDQGHEGHEVFEYNLPGSSEAYQLCGTILISDGLKNATRFMSSSEPYTAIIKQLVTTLRIPNFIKTSLQYILSNVFGQTTFSDLLTFSILPDVAKLWNYQERKNVLAKEALEAWIKTGEEDGHQMDVLICPVSISPPQKHNTFIAISPSLWPCMIFNLYNYPSAVIPVTKVDDDLDRMGDVDQWLREKLPKNYEGGTWGQKNCYSFYDSKQMAGLPIGVQIVGKKFSDEKVLEFMKYIDGLIKDSKK
ncbi:amidase signature enzyme [Conidiobolus coronatus NRRL 28638]|uniref:Amidase signature enzyme n=1 Tax=Conidiobolus coronatus (strain ATCC 28846 / CBS 209.66 / NRRL 28638) TaxID=796925 RepID=A0A137P6K5_CONC2|nr:amidase signature enzyme [Conidiobolus coronatus NRRL 28638]|eukprot:KXN70625.1 amidase signature enzyme [Conidiobolus coronatus NRRL 28638]